MNPTYALILAALAIATSGASHADAWGEAIEITGSPMYGVETDGTDAVVGYSLPAGRGPVSCSPESGSTLPLGVHRVACTAIGRDGNVAEERFSVMVYPRTEPDIIPPIIDRIPAFAVDHFGMGPRITVEPLVVRDGTGSCEVIPNISNRNSVLSCTATDDAGNISSYRSIILYTLDGVVQMPSLYYTMLVLTNGTDAVVTFDHITDGRDYGCSGGPDNVFPVGTHSISCRSQGITLGDKEREWYAAFTLVVYNPSDTRAPRITVPDAIFRNSGADTVVTYDEPVTDEGTISCTHSSGDVFPVGTTAVTCTATDDAGNTTTESFNVNVQDSSRMPELPPALSNVPDTVTVTLEEAADLYAFGFRTYFKPIDRDRPVGLYRDLQPAPMQEELVTDKGTIQCGHDRYMASDGRLTITCRATTNHGSFSDKPASYASFDIIVYDPDVSEAPPVISDVPETQIVLTSDTGAKVTFEMPTSDRGDLSCTHSSGDTFPLGTTHVRCVVEGASHATEASFDVTMVLVGEALPAAGVCKIQASEPSTIFAIIPFFLAYQDDNNILCS